ncbi:MAG TPA: pitrilysin family protein [Longimicrobiaceae bacterium]
MTPLARPVLTVALASLTCACASTAARQAPASPGEPAAQEAPTAAQQAPTAAPFQIPVDYYKLDNGLRVVLSRDTTAPKVVVGVYYNIGFRIEPRDRTGFAHLFEHLMFQGSENLGKMEFIRLVQSNGGVLNGSTRFDFTNYFEIVPSHTLETVLWAEADRMRGLDITEENLENQKGVVTNEVLVNVINQPYGGFPWLDLPQHANTNWYNAHNFYGELEDLQAATLEDARSFFETYYAPNNAALVVVGNFDPEQTRRWIEQYFADIPAAPPAEMPDISEPRQTEEKRASRTDEKATRPALALGYHAPPRNTPEYFAFGVLNEILTQGRDSRLYQALVQERGLTGDVSGGINLLGNMFNINGPTLMTIYLFHDQNVEADSIVAVIDEVIDELMTTPLSQEELDEALVQVRSALYDEVESMFGFGRADLLASFALFDDDPSRINRLEEEFRSVTPELLQRTAQEYLRPTNRTILTIEPGAAPGQEGQ